MKILLLSYQRGKKCFFYRSVHMTNTKLSNIKYSYYLTDHSISSFPSIILNYRKVHKVYHKRAVHESIADLPIIL